MSSFIANGRTWDLDVMVEHALETMIWTGYKAPDFIVDQDGAEVEQAGELIELDSDADLAEELRTDGFTLTFRENLKEQMRDILQQSEDKGILEQIPDHYTDEQFAHDFILTSQHQGAGFWDRGLGDAGDVLTSLSESIGDESTLTAWWHVWSDGSRRAEYAYE